MPRRTRLSGAAAVMSAPFEAHPPRAHRLDARERAQQRRLACAVGADQRHQFALAHMQVDALQRRNAPVVTAQSFDLEHHRCISTATATALAISLPYEPSCATALPRYASITFGVIAHCRGRPFGELCVRSRAPECGRTRPSPAAYCASTSTTVTPRSVSLPIRLSSSIVSVGFSPAAGSSSSISFGAVASARAISSRFKAP